MVSLGTIVNDTLGFFGAKGAGIGYAIDSMPLIGSTQGQLENMMDMYVETAMGRGTGPIQRMMNKTMMGMGGMGMMGGMGGMMGPSMMMGHMGPLCGSGYAGGGLQTMDLGAGTTNIPFLSRLFSPGRRMAGNMEAMMRSNPAARGAFEAQMGGRIVDFGFRNDGKMTIQRFAPGFNPGMMGMNPMAMSGLGAFAGMNHSAMGYMGGRGLGMMGGNPFMAMTMGGMGNIMGMGMGGMGMTMGGMQGPAGAGAGMVDNSGMMGGRGFGSWNPNAMPGQINNTNPYYEGAHQSELSTLLADPSLTVEDKVTLMIMLIMKKMDKDIERQAQYINSIQNQQSSRGSQGSAKGGMMGGNSGPFGEPGGGNNSPSIDVETMKLKRMIDKRGQMFDMLRQIIDKYNETAKGIIQSIGR